MRIFFSKAAAILSRLPKALLPLCLCASFGLASTAAVPAQPPAPVRQPSSARPADAILKEIDEHYNRLASLRTRYTETYTGMGFHRAESGTLTLKKPGRMLWQYDQPRGKVFVLDGKYAWFYTPGDAQAQRIPAKQMDDLRTPLRFLLGHTKLSKELDGITITPTASGFHITGHPRGMGDRVRQLSLDVTGAGVIDAMQIEEIDGATTSFSFTGMQENVPVQNSDFLFTPPSGTAIVNGTPPI